MEFKRFENESDDELIYRVCKNKESIGTWNDVANVLNDLLNTDYNESAFRKKYQSFQKMFEANQTLFCSADEQIENIRAMQRQLEIDKIRFRDERNAWNKQHYVAARVEQKLDYLEEMLREIGNKEFRNHEVVKHDGDTDLICCLSDLHIGQTFDTIFGEYNSDIAAKRLQKYANEVIKIGAVHCAKNVYVTCLGDIISGNIHSTIQITNREDVIEQVKMSAEYIASFLHSLSYEFDNVFFIGASGNHSRIISDKELALHDERLDDLILWIVEQMTSGVNNIHALHRNIDVGIFDISVRGKTYIGTHGDYDHISKQGIGNLTMMLGFIPYGILCGHLHTPMSTEINGVKVIQSGSLAGSGDSYTIEKRLTGKPNQTTLVCDEKGIQCIYNIEL